MLITTLGFGLCPRFCCSPFIAFGMDFFFNFSSKMLVSISRLGKYRKEKNKKKIIKKKSIFLIFQFNVQGLNLKSGLTIVNPVSESRGVPRAWRKDRDNYGKYEV